MSPMTEASQCAIGTIPVVDGLPTVGQSKRYSMHNRYSMATPIRGMEVRI